jgi:hypothetical protein
MDVLKTIIQKKAKRLSYIKGIVPLNELKQFIADADSETNCL